MTDKSLYYKAFALWDACKYLGLRHIRTRPFTPRTNYKAERLIKIFLPEWAYARAWRTSGNLAAELPLGTNMYT